MAAPASPSGSPDFLSKMPLEVAIGIGFHLSISDLYKFAQTSKRFAASVRYCIFGVDAARHNSSAIHWALRRCGDEQQCMRMIERSVQYNGDMNAKFSTINGIEWRPIHMAFAEGMFEVASFLMDHGAAFDTIATNLHLASRSLRKMMSPAYTDIDSKVLEKIEGFAWLPLCVLFVRGDDSIIEDVVRRYNGFRRDDIEFEKEPDETEEEKKKREKEIEINKLKLPKQLAISWPAGRNPDLNLGVPETYGPEYFSILHGYLVCNLTINPFLVVEMEDAADIINDQMIGCHSTALHLAVRTQDIDFLNHILEFREALSLDINACDRNGETALHVAIDNLGGRSNSTRNDIVTMVKGLIDAGAAPNLARDTLTEETPLHLLVRHMSWDWRESHVHIKEVFTILMGAGARLRDVDYAGKSVLYRMWEAIAVSARREPRGSPTLEQYFVHVVKTYDVDINRQVSRGVVDIDTHGDGDDDDPFLPHNDLEFGQDEHGALTIDGPAAPNPPFARDRRRSFLGMAATTKSTLRFAETLLRNGGAIFPGEVESVLRVFYRHHENRTLRQILVANKEHVNKAQICDRFYVALRRNETRLLVAMVDMFPSIDWNFVLYLFSARQKLISIPFSFDPRYTLGGRTVLHHLATMMGYSRALSQVAAVSNVRILTGLGVPVLAKTRDNDRTALDILRERSERFPLLEGALKAMEDGARAVLEY